MQDLEEVVGGGDGNGPAGESREDPIKAFARESHTFAEGRGKKKECTNATGIRGPWDLDGPREEGAQQKDS